MHQSKFLESKTKTSFHNHRAKTAVGERTLTQWSNNNFYRTSYNDMTVKIPTARQSSVIPGYAGYVPRVKVNNQYLGKRMTEQSRDVLKESMIDTQQNMFSTTGFNAQLIPKEDLTMEVRSRRYGTRTMMNTATNFQPENYNRTTMRDSFFHPKVHDNPVWRSRDKMQVFESGPKLKVANKSDARASGYAGNRQEWDGTTWRTEKNQHTDQVRTSYRNNFNQPKPFHKMHLMMTDGRLKRKQQVFDVKDK